METSANDAPRYVTRLLAITFFMITSAAQTPTGLADPGANATHSRVKLISATKILIDKEKAAYLVNYSFDFNTRAVHIVGLGWFLLQFRDS